MLGLREMLKCFDFVWRQCWWNYFGSS